MHKDLVNAGVSPAIETRFFSKTLRNEDTRVINGHKCLEWQAAKNRAGYGRFWFVGDMSFAHRASFTLTYGFFPQELQVLHMCDNASCVEPNHLFLGTGADNMRDKLLKKRQNLPRGEQHWNSRLTDTDVRMIFELSATGLSQRAIGNELGCSQQHVGDILRGDCRKQAA